MKSIILAGGSGSRLWPLSREEYPKQLLSFNEKESLLQKTFKRLESFCAASEIVTITNIKHYSDIKFQLNSIDKNNVVTITPMYRDEFSSLRERIEKEESEMNKHE